MENKDDLLVFNIQKYSLHDGSGIRTVVFLKGCPLRCRWCCNPESQQVMPEIMYRRQKCLGKEKCGLCGSFSGNCISFDEEGKARLDYKKANESTLSWVTICPTNALTVEGKWMPVGEILDLVERDAVFYRSGGGGLTVSGGEPLLQVNTVKLLQEAKKRHLHTAIETCGYVEPDRMLMAAGYLDEIFFDIKSLDDEKHKVHTGVENKRIRENLKRICKVYPQKKITVRTPVIPGFNDKAEELLKIEKFVNGFSNVNWQKMPYHTYGEQKYAMLGRVYSL